MIKRVGRVDFLAIFCEGDKLSIGRIMLWVTFLLMIYFWLVMIEVPATLMTAFMVFVSYNLGKKAQDVVVKWIECGNDNETME